MTTALDTPKDFQTRMMERIKDSIGDLITDQELKAIVSRGIEDAFFKPGKETRGYNTYDTPSTIQKIVTELMQKQVEEAVKKEMANRQDEIAKMVQQVVQDGMGAAMVQVISRLFNNEFYAVQDRILTTIRNMPR